MGTLSEQNLQLLQLQVLAVVHFLDGLLFDHVFELLHGGVHLLHLLLSRHLRSAYLGKHCLGIIKIISFQSRWVSCTLG